MERNTNKTKTHYNKMTRNDKNAAIKNIKPN